MSEWQPIETAPKDGTPILATNANYAFTLQRCVIVYWGGVISDSERPGFSNVGWHNQYDDEDQDAPYAQLTHWMPLPEPPLVA